MAKDRGLKKPFGRQIAKWKEAALTANPTASNEDLATIINDMARKQGFNYTIAPDRVRPKAKRRGRRGGARRRAKAAAAAAVLVPVPAAAPVPANPGGQLQDDLRTIVHLVGKDAAKSLVNDLVKKL
jgi:hypothetical protein